MRGGWKRSTLLVISNFVPKHWAALLFSDKGEFSSLIQPGLEAEARSQQYNSVPQMSLVIVNLTPVPPAPSPKGKAGLCSPLEETLIYHCAPMEDRQIYMWGQHRTEGDLDEINT